MTACLENRGPDAEGSWSSGPVGLGHRRLNIIDPTDTANQPMIDNDLGLAIVFNGTIFNYAELKENLISSGYDFFTASDTEVILKAYRAWGGSFIERLDGIFSFVIYDLINRTLTLGRDRLGIKPLYYHSDNQRVRFASTLPALLAPGDFDAKICRKGLHYYMTLHGIVPAPHTIIKGIEKLPPATLREISPKGEERNIVYWKLSYRRSRHYETLSQQDWVDLTHEMVARAVRKNTVSDVPLGVLLSGGLDSSLIVANLAERQKVRTYSIGFEDVGNISGHEFAASDYVSRYFGTVHEKILVGEAELLESIPSVIKAMSEPMVSHDCAGFFLLAQNLRAKTTVVQSGQGADEVFAGYHWYPGYAKSADLLQAYISGYFDRTGEELESQLTEQWQTSKDYSREYVGSHLRASDGETQLDRALHHDIHLMLPEDPVKRLDNMTASLGVEGRVPFLDHELVEMASRMPPDLKLMRGGKGVLKHAADKLLPRRIVDRKKGYFPVPPLVHVKGKILELITDTLSDVAVGDRGIFNRKYIQSLRRRPMLRMTPLGGAEVWQLAVLELWLRAQGVR